MERESLRLLLNLTPWIQTDPLPNVVGCVGWSSFRRMAVWPNIGLSSYSPVRRWAAAIVSDVEDVDQQIQRIQSGTARYMDGSPQPQADQSRQSTTASCTRCAPVTSGKSISGLSIKP